ncbi:hypothetical protein XBP1_1400008 [Xenorhabdus bovienii str. puntauvense]|uniref:Uncharacterized protein n=1 Tax=Xenorhabdus bovienii str. puntauvense TaxID=1398201 RepID=A0A077NCB1_XENBV|nr:hypothetical protein XBP1_1400008 [Xenorhabdus bovienii str. puntauvense]
MTAIVEPQVTIAIVKQRIYRHLLMITPNRPEPRLSDQVEAFDISIPPINQVAY